MRYAAFISYNHRDRKAAAWLQRALETYRIPRRLQGRDGALGIIGARLPPVFRDREDLAASGDLAASVRAGLEDSASLVVICSPNGAKSRWVNEEIRAFTALGRRARLQCLIISGEPGASARPGIDPDLECLPPALFEDGGAEPLAADIRAGQDDRGAARLKIIAGILGVGYDELRQREAARRQRRLATIAGGSAVGFVAMAGLAGVALVARQDAVRERDIARQKTLTAERTVNFVKSLFEVADPSEARGRSITAREILDRGARQLQRDLADEPTVKAELSTTLGEVYGGLGLFRDGEALIGRGLALPAVARGTRARALVAVGEAQWKRSDYLGAIDTLRRSIALIDATPEANGAMRARALSDLADAEASVGRLDVASGHANAALASDRMRGGPNALEVARDQETLLDIAMARGDLAAAKRHLTAALAIRTQVQGVTQPKAMEDLTNLGSVAYLQNDLPAAEAAFTRGVRAKEAVLGPTHPELAADLNNLARVLLERQRFADARPLLLRAVAIDTREREGTDDLAFEYANLGIAERGLGRLAEAARDFARAETIARARKHRNLAPILVEQAELACNAGEPARGLARLSEAAPIMARDYPGDPWRMAWLNIVRADCLGRDGQRAQALALMADNRKAIRDRWPKSTLYGARLDAAERRLETSRG